MNCPIETIKIEVIKTDVGFYIKTQRDFPDHYNGCAGATGLDYLLLDGKPGNSFEKSHCKYWVKITELPKKIQRIDKQPNINYRFELIDKTLVSVKFPAQFKKEDVSYRDEDGYEQWKDGYAHLKSLYREVSDTQPDLTVDVPFEYKTVLEIDEIKEYSGFSYPVQKTRWESEGFTSITDKDVKHNLIDTVLFPGIILPARESKLTSEQSYKIIRKHIQDNINPKYAHITSDYDFCFTVKKKIPLAKKEAYQKDISRWGAKKPKYITDYRLNREIEVFEMTHTGQNYKGYTPIKGFEGRNVEELKENIDNYLKDLMEMINCPLVDCPNCKGTGVLVQKDN